MRRERGATWASVLGSMVQANACCTGNVLRPIDGIGLSDLSKSTVFVVSMKHEPKASPLLKLCTVLAEIKPQPEWLGEVEDIRGSSAVAQAFWYHFQHHLCQFPFIKSLAFQGGLIDILGPS